GNAIEPVAQGGPRTDRCRLANEHEEGGLKRVVGVVLVPQDPPAHPQDHRPVSAQKHLKGRLLLPGYVPFQKIAVGEACPVRVERNLAKLLDHPVHSTRRHRSSAPRQGYLHSTSPGHVVLSKNRSGRVARWQVWRSSGLPSPCHARLVDTKRGEGRGVSSVH